MKPLFAVFALTLAAGCAPATQAPAAVAVTGAWCRAAPVGALAGGCYLTLTASADDRLVSVATPAAKRAEIHSMDMTGGVMRMRQLKDGLALPAGKAVTLKPGAEHLMIIGPKQVLAAGGAVPLTLTFKKAPPQTISAPIRDAAAPAMQHHGGH
ncbi:copper chaperone PCu(A)C [Phenylobacterium sp. LH3H17]|uniref:copper chaperone PCu(A)C n=1 Tax=Phenylobacterium sp. LH3H17 TaxID=2903901 RepID=UPI0020C96A73|nr:copper chaperone PCu(A)C [Phenylobacterium sp. LH3H17]UTP38459.1 copper chaperone PCu(A)C [Phenylobacterium sp. LH3H17]